MCNDNIQNDQNAKECDAERVALANLIANLTLDTEENKKILKQLKKANASLTQELKECKSNLEESNTTHDSCVIALQSLVKEKTKVITDLKLKEEYAQWQSRFLRYINTRPNGDALRKCILEGPYTPSTVTILTVHSIEILHKFQNKLREIAKPITPPTVIILAVPAKR
ncbi:hypothetical protein Tco_0063049 [Tanacetum coccineum]